MELFSVSVLVWKFNIGFGTSICMLFVSTPACPPIFFILIPIVNFNRAGVKQKLIKHFQERQTILIMQEQS